MTEIDNVVMEKVCRVTRDVKTAYEKYLFFSGKESLTLGEKRQIGAALKAYHEAKDAREVKEHEIYLETAAKIRLEFQTVIENYQKGLTDALNLIAKRYRFADSAFEVSLTERDLRVIVKLPEFWNEAASLHLRFGHRAGVEDVLEVRHGSGGHNDGFTTVQISRQRANALNALCDFADEIKIWEWAPFRGLEEHIRAESKRRAQEAGK